LVVVVVFVIVVVVVVVVVVVIIVVVVVVKVNDWSGDISCRQHVLEGTLTLIEMTHDGGFNGRGFS